MKAGKRLMALLAVIAVTLTLGYVGGKKLFVKVLAQASVDVRPFVAGETQFYVNGGKKVVTSKDTMCRRRDGAFRRTSTFYNADGSELMNLSRVDLPDGHAAMVSDDAHVKTSGLKPSNQTAAMKNALLNPPPNCLNPAGPGNTPEVVDGHDALFGFPATRIVHVASSGTDRLVSWRLPDFQCEEVQTFRQTLDASGNWQTTMGKELTSFAEADPDPQMFTNWAGYSEVKPSDLKRAVFTNRGLTAAACPTCFTEDTESDARYQKLGR